MKNKKLTKRKDLVFLYKFKKKIKITLKVVSVLLVVVVALLIILGEKHVGSLLLNVSSYYKKQLYNVNYNICNRLIINGIKYSNLNEVQNLVSQYCYGKNGNINNLRNQILENPWVKDVYIQKKFPNSLVVNIVEYNPFAIILDDNKEFKLVDEFGDIINISDNEIREFNYLFMITGENFKKEINNLFNMLSIYYNVANKITKVRRVGDRRWDLILNKKLLVKMPEENEDIVETWNILDKILNIYGFDINLEEIDLRLKDKIFLKYKDKTAEEIKNRY